MSFFEITKLIIEERVQNLTVNILLVGWPFKMSSLRRVSGSFNT